MMKEKIYSGEELKEAEHIIDNGIKLFQVEFVRTEDGIGCATSTSQGFSELIELAGKDENWLTEKMKQKLATLAHEVATIYDEIEDCVLENALNALKKEMKPEIQN